MRQAAGSGRVRLGAAVLAVAGLLLAVAIVGVVGLAINSGTLDTVDEALQYDVDLEDEGDDLQVAVLDVRHYHRDMLFNGPQEGRVQAWEQRYATLQEEIGEYAALVDSGLDLRGLPDADQLRSAAAAYYEPFREAVDAYRPSNHTDFEVASDGGLADLDVLAGMTARLDQAGEERAEAAFTEIEQAAGTGTLVLVAVVAGLGLMAAGLGFVVLRMIDGQRRLMAAEQQVAAEVAATSQAKTDFIADASHELRTPLTVLRGNAELGLSMGPDGEHAEILRDIVNESTRMAKLVEDMLFLARSDASSVPLELQTVEADALFESIASRAAVLARGQGASLSAELRVAGQLRVDRARVEQAVLVLVDNAAKHAGGEIELRARRDDATLVVEVADRGQGIPAEDRMHIFERFYRAAARSGAPASKGAGLGLSIAATIVRGHGGQIEADARPDGPGTVMRITLPVVAAPSAPTPARRIGS